MNQNIIPVADQCDQHAVKFPLEQCQMLCTAHHELGSAVEGMYRPTHRNHPCSIWIRATAGNYRWALRHFENLLEEKLFRFGTPHKSGRLLTILSNLPAGIDMSDEVTPFPQCMPDEFKQSDAEEAYKNYLNFKYSEWMSRDKPLIPRWTVRPMPSWVRI